MNGRVRIFLASLFLIGLIPEHSFAATVEWADLQTFVRSGGGGPFTNVQGNISGTVGITYTGSAWDLILDNSGANYWTEYDPPPYTGSALVDNAPEYDIIRMDWHASNTITFSEPVWMPLMAIISLGNSYATPTAVTYDFGAGVQFSILSEGSSMYGAGTNTLGDGSITGEEFSGVIRFDGWVDQISWTSTPSEHWHGFTFGLVGHNKFIDITNKNETVADTVSLYSVGGTNAVELTGNLWWTNSANNANGIIPVTGTSFEVVDIPLEYSDNMISVYGSNEVGIVGSDHIVIYRRQPEHLGSSPVHYAATNGLAVWPYTNWTTAAVSLQNAVDAAGSNDTVLVEDGTYNSGGASVSNMQNRVAVTKAVSVQSVNGPDHTFIAGKGPLGSDAMRCAYLTAGAELKGFTLTSGYGGDGSFVIDGQIIEAALGGGVFFSQGGTVSNCVISGNTAHIGGGAFSLNGGILNDCTISSNTATAGSGIVGYFGVTASDCIITGNVAGEAGGGAFCLHGGVFTNCIISSNSALSHGGGVRLEHDFTMTGCTISDNTASNGAGVFMESNDLAFNCIVTGNSAIEKGGGVRIASAIGAPVREGGSVVGSTVSSNSAAIGGGIYGERSVIADSSVFANSAEYGGGIYGDWELVVTNSSILANSADYGGGSYDGTLDHCTISSNHAALTGGGIHTATANNCTFTGNSAVNDGGGSAYSTLTSCTITGNSTDSSSGLGGGSAYSTLTNCVLSGNNSVLGGGSAYSTLSQCMLTGNNATGVSSGFGGGSYNGQLDRCRILSNSARSGGGSYLDTLANCWLKDNVSSAGTGGGSAFSTLVNCTLRDNESFSYGGGCYDSTLTNCIVYNNNALGIASIPPYGSNWHSSVFVSSCTSPDPGGTGNIDYSPGFASVGDYHLLSNSPCIDAGINLLSKDINGTSRPLDGDNNGNAIADMGAHELASPVANTDGDPVSDYEEYLADTDSTDSNDWFRIVGIEALPSALVFFQSSAARQYTLLWSTNLTDGAWTNIPGQVDIMGSGGLDSLSGSSNYPAVFYQLEVEVP